MSFWCHRFDQNTKEIFLKISALASKKSSNKKSSKGILFFFNYLNGHKSTYLVADLYKVEIS